MRAACMSNMKYACHLKLVLKANSACFYFRNFASSIYLRYELKRSEMMHVCTFLTLMYLISLNTCCSTVSNVVCRSNEYSDAEIPVLVKIVEFEFYFKEFNFSVPSQKEIERCMPIYWSLYNTFKIETS